ncbi:hypothetical protein CLU79DRAFT_770044, partial [Phycomyces nitens]
MAQQQQFLAHHLLEVCVTSSRPRLAMSIENFLTNIRTHSQYLAQRNLSVPSRGLVPNTLLLNWE